MKKPIAFLLLSAVLVGCGQGFSTKPGVHVPESTGQAFPPFLQATPAENGRSNLALPSPTPLAAVIVEGTLAPTALPEPSATSSPEPIQPVLDSDCLVGTWSVANLSSAMVETMSQEQSSLALDGVKGQVLYEFAPDGSLRITFNDLAAAMEGQVEGEKVHVVNSLEGSGTARYAVDALREEVALSDFGGEGIQSALEINGQVLMESSLPVWSAFTSGKPVESNGDAPGAAEENLGEVAISRAAAACEGDTLTLQAVEPVPGPEVQLERVH